MKRFFEIDGKAEFFNVVKYTMRTAKRKSWTGYAGLSTLMAVYDTDIFTELTVFIQRGASTSHKSPRVTLFTDLHTMYVYEAGVIKKYNTANPYEHKLLDVIVA